MVSKEVQREKNRERYKTKKRALNKKIGLQQVCFNFYIPTTSEQMGKKIRLINIDVVGGRLVIKD